MSLIEDAKNKNPDAFEQLIQPQLQRMYRVAISMLHNEEDAADAIQETVLKCWQKIGQLKSEEYFGTWLTRILFIIMLRKSMQTPHLMLSIMSMFRILYEMKTQVM